MTRTSASSDPVTRLKITIRGAVQGVGFRPFVYRLANELNLRGWVNNSPYGVFIEAEGPQPVLQDFLLRLETEKPPRSFIQSLEPAWLDPVGFSSFEIRPSETSGSKTALVMPDIATCPDCRREIFDPQNRRYFYPFTNCTNCGPRFSLIEGLPYDRANTSMKQFTMCPLCQAEYDNPGDRRFHAQPNACPSCGPRLELWDNQGKPLLTRGSNEPVLKAAAEAIARGQIVAVKGLGGFHLMVAAHDEAAVRKLREKKHREEKPFALMFPSLESVKRICEVSALEERVLRSPEAPIVLLRRRKVSSRQGSGQLPAESVAPNNPNLGVMLPYTPLHHLLLAHLGFPVVATSGNLSDEPICIDEREAVERLGGIAELFLVHNRPIVRHVDDSIVRVMSGRELVLRRARGYAPLPVEMPAVPSGADSVLAVGAHLKNTIALSVGPQVFISQHIGDLETDAAYEAFRGVIADFERLYEGRAAIVAADPHPDYLSTQFARQLIARSATPTPQWISVQHHLAHVLSCMAENQLEPPVLGVSWDGTGYGLDETIWGGEFFHLSGEMACERVAHFRQFRLPGGEIAIKEPRRSALGLLFEIYGAKALELQDLKTIQAFSAAKLASLGTMLERKLNSPLTSSVGRLFDAVASLIGLRQVVRFEGQAAMELEFALEGPATNETYPITCRSADNLSPATNHPVPLTPSLSPSDGERVVPHAGPGEGIVKARLLLHTSSSPGFVLDWAPLLDALLSDVRAKAPAALISARFHNALVEAVLLIARELDRERVVLSGGCFQNRYLTEQAIERLRQEGFRPYWHQRVPPNDGGIALGQAAAALHSFTSARNPSRIGRE